MVLKVLKEINLTVEIMKNTFMIHYKNKILIKLFLKKSILNFITILFYFIIYCNYNYHNNKNSEYVLLHLLISSKIGGLIIFLNLKTSINSSKFIWF